jgi:hypothetical protein
MKRTNLLKSCSVALTVVLAGCSSQTDLSFDKQGGQSFGATRSITEAIDIAKKTVDFFPSISRVNVSVDESNVSVIRSSYSRSTSSVDTILYAINYDDNQGFVLISAPRSVEPIVAITESGSFDSDDTQSNENFQYVLKAAELYVQTAADENNESLKTTDSMIPFGRDISEFQTPRLSVQWGQGWPENIFCPNDTAGCVPVAIAQICSYFSQPSQINLTFDEKDKNSQVLDWTGMKKHIKTTNRAVKPIEFNDSLVGFVSDSLMLLASTPDLNTPSGHVCEATDESHYAIGRFVRQIGELANCEYKKKGGTGTERWDAANALKILLPDKSYTDSYTSDASEYYELLKNDGVAMVLANLKDSEPGHVWVADATGVVGYMVYNYERDEDGNLYVASETEEATHFIHYNWGWNGDSNGYFAVGIFNTKNGNKYDNTKNTANYDLSKNVEFIYIK